MGTLLAYVLLFIIFESFVLSLSYYNRFSVTRAVGRARAQPTLIHLLMSPAPPTKVLKVIVPRQNAQRLGPAVTAEVQNLARDQGLIVQLPPPVQEQPGSSGASVVSALFHNLAPDLLNKNNEFM